MPQAVFGKIGRQVRVSASAHRGASTSTPELASWVPNRGSADSDLLPDLPLLDARSRDLTRNSGIASGVLQTYRDNIVGPYWKLSAKPDYRALGKSKEWAEEWSRITESKWQQFADSTDCDVAGCLNFHGLTNQVFTGAMLNGDGLSLVLWRPDRLRKYATQFQVIESDRLSNPNGRMDSDKLRGGIEIDEFGRPLAYHIQKSHPGDALLWFGFSGLNGQWERIPAETPWGRKRVIHIHDRERSGQTRGKPLLTPILADFKMLDHYQRTELKAAIVNSLIAAFVETPLDSTQIAEMFGGDTKSEEYQEYLAQRRQHLAQLKGASIIPVMPGDKVQPFIPGRPATAFAAFLEALERQMGVGVNLPLELLKKDFSKTNYSSARAALLESWRFFLGRRRWLTSYWSNPAYDLWLEEAVQRSEIEAPGFYENRIAYTRCRWISAGRGWIDPVKEAQAAEIRMNIRLSTLEDECAEQGLDWEEVLEQLAREKARAKELGLTLTAPVSQPQQQPEDEEDQAA